MVVANDIKCEAQQELRAVKRRLLEEEEKNARLQKALGDARARGRWVSATGTRGRAHLLSWPGLLASTHVMLGVCPEPSPPSRFLCPHPQPGNN